MNRNLPPLPPHVSGLMEEERARPTPDAAVLARVKSRLHASVAAGVVVDVPRAPSWPRVFNWTHVVGSAGILGMVAAAAWMAQTRFERPAPVVEVAVPHKAQEPVVETAVETVVEVAPAMPQVEQPAAPVVPVVHKRETRARPRVVASQDVAAPEPLPAVEAETVKPPAAQELAEEHQILERARMHLQALRTDEARGALEEYGRRFPSGRLAEERQALEVVLLARSGDVEAAQRAADAFKTTHRRSLFQPMIEQALKR